LRAFSKHIYQEEYRLCETETVCADQVVCALPIYQLQIL